MVNHPEAGIFDTMTEATIWALKNVSDWDWWIEPVDGTASEKPALLPGKTAIKLCFGNTLPQTVRQNADGTRLCIE